MGVGVVVRRVEPCRGDDVHAGRPAHVDEAGRVAAGVDRHAIAHRASPALAELAQLGRGDITIGHIEIWVLHNTYAAANEHVIVSITEAELGWFDVTENRADHGDSPSGSSSAPSAISVLRNCPASTSDTEAPASATIAAAVPAACPMAMHCAMLRADACASWLADRQRPATTTRSRSAGSRHRIGIS